MSISIQQDTTLYSLFISVICSTFFEWYPHPTSGAHVTVFTVYGINETCSATCHERDWAASSRPVTSTTGSTTGLINPLTPNDAYRGRTAPLTSMCRILYIYSTNIGTVIPRLMSNTANKFFG